MISAIFFSDFYINKLFYICSTISNKLLLLDTSYDLTSVNYYSDNHFHSFCSVSYVEIYNVIITLKSSSSIDPLPISLFHNLAYFLTPFISTVVNSSLSTWEIPDILKHAVVIPLLKKHNLDKEILPNYRPISQLPFISKIMEKIVDKQLNNYLLHFNILDPKQIRFGKCHSTETTLISLIDDILLTLDHNNKDTTKSFGRSLIIIIYNCYFSMYHQIVILLSMIY